MASLKSVSTISYVWHLERTALDSLTLRITCRQRGRQGCPFEYRTLVRAFAKEITPHIDQEVAKRVLDTNWLQRLESEPTQK
jgi:hypothetical protein